MVVAENDPLKSLLNSVQVAFSPLGSNFQNLAKNLDHCFDGVVKNEARNFNDRRKGKVRVSYGCNEINNVDFRFGVDKLNVNQLQERCESDNGVNWSENLLHFEVALPFFSSWFSDSSVRVEAGERVVGGIKPKKSNVEGKRFVAV